MPREWSTKVATFNCHGGRGDDGALDLARTAAAIRATEASLVALQELDRNRARSGGADQPAQLSRLTGLEVGFEETVGRGRSSYGIALAGAGVEDRRFEPLLRVSDEEPRGAIVARWRSLSVVATHLARQRPVAARQLEELAALTAGLEPPVLVLGDLNLPRRSLEPLLALGFDAGPRIGTFRSPVVRSQIDYVLAGPGLRLVRTWVVETDASDHLPLAAELRRP